MALVRRAHTRTLAACLFAVPFLAGAIPGFASESVNGGGSPDVTRSLVKVYATKRLPDLARPWSKQPSGEVTGSGMVIAGRRILTSNHVVSYASTVLVQPEGSSEKLRARVVAADLGIDLAVLEPENTSLFAAYPPIAISDDLPDVGSAVAVYGYPTGGQSMSVTKGVVSRVEVADYFDALALRIQVDAALNPGNSGGPALVGDQLVGVAFSVANSTQNIGYLVPTEEVRSFLNAVDKGEAPAHPRLPISRQTLDNAALRSWLGLETAGQGDVITCLESEVDDYPLKKWDVLSAIGEHDIDNSGLVELKPGLRVAADYFVPKLVHDGRVPMTVMRDGKRLQVEVPVAGAPDRVMKPLNGSYPSYFIVGPLTFSIAYLDHLPVLKTVLDPFLWRSSPILSRATAPSSFTGEELVLGPARLFSHRIGQGYSVPPFPVLKAVNGVPVRNLKHLVELIRDSRDRYLVFEWFDRDVESLVFNREELLKSTDEVLADNDIRNAMSDDLLPTWQGR